MIHDEICTYEVAKLAREKGFPQDVFGTFAMESACYLDDGRFYKDGCICPIEKAYTAPTQNLLQRWLREERGVIVEVFMDDDSNMPLTYNIHQYKDWNWECVCHHHGNYYAVNDWELCLEDALKWTLENLV